MNTPLFFESAGDERVTPQDFFDRVHAEFQFDLDAAASSLNHKVDTWFGEGGVEDDALNADWGGLTCWLNPPYSVCGAFVAKAVEESGKGATVAMLVPVRSDTKWWHAYIWDKDKDRWRDGITCRFIPGRLGFELRTTVTQRDWIKHEASTQPLPDLIKLTGFPISALKRILDDVPDEDLLDSAPFPSCLIVARPIV